MGEVLLGGEKVKLLTCFPLRDDQLSQIRQAVPEWQLLVADQENVGDLIADCDVFCGHARHQQIDWGRVVAKGRLRWIQSSAAGMDHCLSREVIASSIQVSGCSGLFRDSVAEQTMALLFGLLRRLPVFFRAQQNREFVRRPTDDLHGKTVGIVGFGGNGQRIAEVLGPWGNRLLATDLFPDEWRLVGKLPRVSELWPADRLPDLLKQSDVVILTLPLNAATQQVIGPQQLQCMPSGSYLINVGRGRLLNEPALLAALRSGRLQGVGLDVTWTEPLPAESGLWTEPSALITPHVGAQSGQRYQRVVDLLLENLPRFQRGQRLKNLVDKSLGFSRPGDRQ